jgi:hypothetical protein
MGSRHAGEFISRASDGQVGYKVQPRRSSSYAPCPPFLRSLLPTEQMQDLLVRSTEWKCTDLSFGPRKTTSEGVRAEDGVMGGGGDYIKPILGHSLDEKKVRDLDL